MALSCRVITGDLVSYDVNKDGVKVAVLTFTKSAYRLGETVMGVVEVNARASRTRVLKASCVELPPCVLLTSELHVLVVGVARGA